MLLALAGLFAVAVIGVLSMLAIAQHQLANARLTQDLLVTVATPGLRLQDAEQQVTVPLENALSAVKGVESIRSTTTTDVVMIAVRVTAIGLQAPDPASLVQDALRGALPSLPRDLGVPTVQQVQLDPPTHHFIARADTLSRLELSRWLDEVLRREVEVQQGVREVRLCGAVRPELTITLDPARLRAFNLGAGEVVRALQLSSLEVPGGRLAVEGAEVKRRGADASLETLGHLALRGPELQLREVATLQLGAVPGRCSTAADVLVSVHTFAPGEPTRLPVHPAVTLTPFTPLHTATFLSAAGHPVEASLRELARTYPGAVVTSEGDRLSVLLSAEAPVKDVPGLALRSVDEAHTVVRVSGPDFEQLTQVAPKVRGALAKENPRWLGTAWPGLAPERVITPAPGVKDVALALQLAIVGVETGTLPDGTGIRVRAGTSIDDAVLPDGRAVREVVRLEETLAPGALLRVNRQRVVEVEVGLEPAAALRAVRSVDLPAGVSVSAENSHL